MTKKIAILQSNYIPWKGYFDIIDRVDEFIIYDCVQYTKNDWRNRNQIKTAQGKKWLTIPVKHEHSGQLINETFIADRACFRKHFNTFRQSYARAAYIDYCVDRLQSLFVTDALPADLSRANVLLIEQICRLLSIDTKITRSDDYLVEGDRNERLINLCKQAGAQRYLSGRAAQAYLDTTAFDKAGIEVEWMEYGHYPEYGQPHPPFDHHVSILDLLACTGPAAKHHIRGSHP